MDRQQAVNQLIAAENSPWAETDRAFLMGASRTVSSPSSSAIHQPSNKCGIAAGRDDGPAIRWGRAGGVDRDPGHGGRAGGQFGRDAACGDCGRAGHRPVLHRRRAGAVPRVVGRGPGDAEQGAQEARRHFDRQSALPVHRAAAHGQEDRRAPPAGPARRHRSRSPTTTPARRRFRPTDAGRAGQPTRRCLQDPGVAVCPELSRPLRRTRTQGHGQQHHHPPRTPALDQGAQCRRRDHARSPDRAEFVRRGGLCTRPRPTPFRLKRRSRSRTRRRAGASTMPMPRASGSSTRFSRRARRSTRSLENAAVAVVGTLLESAGDGTLQVRTTGAVVARALEALTASGPTRIKVEVA